MDTPSDHPHTAFMCEWRFAHFGTHVLVFLWGTRGGHSYSCFTLFVRLSDFVNEVEVLCALRHPNVVLFMGACTSPPNLCIVTELASK